MKIQLRAIYDQPEKHNYVSTQILLDMKPMCIIDIKPSILIMFLDDLLKALGCETAKVEMYNEKK